MEVILDKKLKMPIYIQIAEQKEILYELIC